jgi:AGZA family xanthine/uracil permease-like MFS transporter
VVAGTLFLGALFFSPVVALIGSYPCITAPALVLIGSMMVRNVVHVAWDDASEALPAFLIIVGLPLTHSIADGIALGLVAYSLVKLVAGRGRECSLWLHGLALLLLFYFLALRSEGPLNLFGG